METVNKAGSTWKGSFQVVNNSTMTISCISAEHCASGSSTATISVASMVDGAISPKRSFETTSGSKDYWIVSFVDSSGNLCTGYLTLAFHDSDSIVIISLQPQGFSVSIGDRAENEDYLQKTI